MTRYITDDLIEAVERFGTVIRVVITRTQGSTPRNAGASMIVAKDEFLGTIGGGKLEFQALDLARKMLVDEPETIRKTETFVLGTELRQCCGGVAWLLLERVEADQMVNFCQFHAVLQPDSLLMRTVENDGTFHIWPQQTDKVGLTNGLPASVLSALETGETGKACLISDTETGQSWFIEPAARKTANLYIYGAGHLGRALVHILKDTPFDVTWVEFDETRFPADCRDDVKTVVCEKQADFAANDGASGGYHVVVTHSHESDLEICRAVLASGTAKYLGLIASGTKKAKFLNRLKKDGISEEAFDIFRCPIGLVAFKHKDPSIVAISIAAQLIAEYEEGEYELMNSKTGDCHVH